MRKQYLFVQPSAVFARIPASHLQNQNLCAVASVGLPINQSVCLPLVPLWAPGYLLAPLCGWGRSGRGLMLIGLEARSTNHRAADERNRQRITPTAITMSVLEPGSGTASFITNTSW